MHPQSFRLSFPASPLQARPATSDPLESADCANPFSHPRLVQATPPRHSSPYDMARGVHSQRSPSGRAALAHAERVAAARGACDDGDTDAQLSELLRGSEEELQRLSLSGQRAAAAGTALSLQSAFAAAAYGFESPVRNRAAAAAALSHSHSASPAHSSPVGRLAFGSTGGAAVAAASSAATEQSYYDLLKAAREGDTSIVKQLLSSHSASDSLLDVNYQDRDGDTALHRACAGGHLELVRQLVLEGRADIHRTNRDGDTPLLVNVKSRTPHAALVRFLIECGGDIHAKNAMGVSVVSSLAAAAGQPALASGWSMSTPAAAGGRVGELHQLVLDAHANPVRHYVLLQNAELARTRALLEAATIRCEALQQAHSAQASQLSAQETQLRQSHAALTAGIGQLHAMDSELERVARAQVDAQLQAQQTDPTTPQPTPTPQVLIAEVRRALISVRHSFTPQSA